VLPCRGGADVARRVFEPLGWTVDAASIPLDEAFPAWGDSRYIRLRLTGAVQVAGALTYEDPRMSGFDAAVLKVHQLAFAILALESEPVDPRL
jgi:hypothetical protein